ncbi:hypothetical protein, partial [uncultured Gammaproteobacteria bacterium]
WQILFKLKIHALIVMSKLIATRVVFFHTKKVMVRMLKYLWQKSVS